MKTVGLTGGIACGKSSVAAILRQRGVVVIDADLASRAIVTPGQPALTELVAAFGPGILQDDGTLDRPALGRLVMSDPSARHTLESITHPRIAARIQEQIHELDQQGQTVAVVEAALMVEFGSFRQHDAIILVRCSPATQIRRLMARQGWDAQRAGRWIAAQMNLDDKQQRVHAAALAGELLAITIDNDGSLSQLHAASARAWSQLCAKLGVSAQSDRG
ncbi:MAG: dephospho-CoA kinase [Oligoflexia bacterium]|nr:dephospho-CoA kinase [Oligoflexia bacterium]